MSLSVCVSVCLSVCLFVCLFICLSVCLSVCLSLSLSLSLSLRLPLLPTLFLSSCVLEYVPTCVCVCMCMCNYAIIFTFTVVPQTGWTRQRLSQTDDDLSLSLSSLEKGHYATKTKDT